MAKRSFLKPLSAVLAALGATTAWGGNKPVDPVKPTAHDMTAPVDPAHTQIQEGEARTVLYRENGDVFKFVLERSEKGVFMAQHESHASHSSHSSHRSHYSSN